MMWSNYDWILFLTNVWTLIPDLMFTRPLYTAATPYCYDCI